MQVTSPLRPEGSLDKAIRHFQNGKYDSLLSICPTHRFFWRTKDDETTYAEYNYMKRPRRQDIKSTDIRYVENGSIYIFNRALFEKRENRLGGKIGFVIWPEEYSMEIDSLLDFKIIEDIFNNLNS